MHLTQCTALSNTNNERTTIGVGEYVNLFFDPPLLMSFPEQPWWLAFSGSVNPSFGSDTLFTAPSNAATAVVRVFVRDVQLDTIFSVKEPTGYDHAVIRRTVSWGAGHWGAEAYVRVFIAPTDVSFGRVEIEEVGLDATDVWGRYAYFLPPNGPYSPGQLKHDPGAFRPISCDNRWNPYAPYDQEGDHVRTSMLPPLYAGGYTWPIPANWRIPGGPTNSLNSWSPQVVTADDNGVMRITKFGIWVERTTNDVYTTGP
jgi:hypothetical protein